jgi:serralysin
MSPNDRRWCFAWFHGKPLGAGTTRAALQKDAKWKSGDTIRVAFVEGDNKLQERVRDVAKRWTAPGLANLKLAFVDSGNADVRVTFHLGDGSWSTVGTTCRQVPGNQATMNYGWINADSAEEELRGVVLHEFGHALGLIHEHQDPVAGIQWNRDAVIKDLSGPPNNWSVEQIEFNVLTPASPDDVDATPLDPKSIMMYPIPARWTKDGFSTDTNTDLSDSDRKFIRKQYT